MLHVLHVYVCALVVCVMYVRVHVCDVCACVMCVRVHVCACACV